VVLTGTDSEITVAVVLPEATSDHSGRFLLPLGAVQSMAKRLPGHSLIHLEAGAIHGEIGSSRVTEAVQSPKLDDFPQDVVLKAPLIPLPDSFRQRFIEALECASTDSSRYILNGVALDVSDSKERGHCLVGTDGRHLFSANSFTLPLKESVVIPSHKLLSWRGLPDLWAIACETIDNIQVIRIDAGIWSLTMNAIYGQYPNWKQVLVRDDQVTTRLTFPKEHAYGEVIQALSGGDRENSPVDIVVADGTVSVKDTVGGAPIELVDVRSNGLDVSIRINRDYLSKAFSFGLNLVGVIDSMSPLRFTREGRTLIVMPLRIGEGSTTPTNPAPEEPQQERKPMPETIEQTRGHASADRSRGAASPDSSHTENVPALEAAIEKLDAFRASVRESLGQLNDLTILLKQALRDQKTGQKEVQSVRQTLRSLQGVKI